MEETYVRHVELLGFEKRSYPSQHYVYMLMVKWSDLSEKLIYRTYPEIYTFHKLLKEMFPIESGEIEKKDRIIPSLPAWRWPLSQKSPETRQSTLAEYLHSLTGLPPHIARCRQLGRFLRVRPEDENPPAPNTLKRNETFVVSRELARGNASEISGPILLDTYRVIADFTKTSKHEIDLHTGDLVEIVEKNQNGTARINSMRVPRGDFNVNIWSCFINECLSCCLQVGGSARESPNGVGSLPPTWSPWTARRRPRKASPTTKEKCSSPIKPTRRSRGTRSPWRSGKPSRSFTSCSTAGGSSGKESRPVTSPPCSCTGPAGRRSTKRSGPPCRDADRRRAGPPSETPRASTAGRASGSARTATAGTAGATSSSAAPGAPRRPPRRR
ncbi:neutrophil cytosol factor 1 isoform X3 [Cyclopterus lumpus]|uniref:neutrophil cytosol factor 1 isoform X3 n=1 Tax=Cyclopterus lumpus TaxID=8103 RepID=UPI0014872FF2|nr:neutrophil cytosol factor 1 isoform X3 [Cyclopterus lumpus]